MTDVNHSPPPVVQLARATLRSLTSLTAGFPAGLTVVLGSPEDGTRELLSIIAGLEPPRGGAVRVAGGDPYRSCELRRRTACVLGDRGDLPEARTVADALAIACDARADGTSPSALLAEFGLSGWAARDPATLDPAEHRAVALCLALGARAPILLALGEPLSGVSGLDRGLIGDELRRRAARGVAIVCATASEADANELAGDVQVLERGRPLRPRGSPMPFAGVPHHAFVARCRRPRELAAALLHDGRVAAVEYDSSASPHDVIARGYDAEGVAVAVAQAALEARVSLDALVRRPARSKGGVR